ncbi:protein lin-54 homolog [Sycon ciliatum]|uniref:protein lin-54 homolog n=1 Tax=Sycon ciliatum TaxID=27933 RepID=UPI0031F62EA6
MSQLPTNGADAEPEAPTTTPPVSLSGNAVISWSSAPVVTTASPIPMDTSSTPVAGAPLTIPALTPTSSGGGLSFLINLPPMPPIDQQPTSQVTRKAAPSTKARSELSSQSSSLTPAVTPATSVSQSAPPQVLPAATVTLSDATAALSSATTSSVSAPPPVGLSATSAVVTAGPTVASTTAAAGTASVPRHSRKPAKSSISHPAPIAPAPPFGAAASLNVMAQTQLLNSLLQMGGINPFLPPKIETSTAQQPVAAPPLRGNSETGAVTGRQRKPCNCSKSMCLKLYCECFANGEFCSNCNCNNCHNSMEHEADRSTAIKACLERNPHAFHPKIQTKRQGEKERRHTKGCHCRRSGCLKNYCECYEARIPCTSICKCIKCKNYEESPDRQTLLQLATAAEVRTQQQHAAARKHLPTPKAENATPLTSMSASGQRLPYTMLREEVTTAMCECWMQRAEQAAQQDATDAAIERAILEEVDMCLRSVILKASQPSRLRS